MTYKGYNIDLGPNMLFHITSEDIPEDNPVEIASYAAAIQWCDNHEKVKGGRALERLNLECVGDNLTQFTVTGIHATTMGLLLKPKPGKFVYAVYPNHSVIVSLLRTSHNVHLQVRAISSVLENMQLGGWSYSERNKLSHPQAIKLVKNQYAQAIECCHNSTADKLIADELERLNSPAKKRVVK